MKRTKIDSDGTAPRALNVDGGRMPKQHKATPIAGAELPVQPSPVLEMQETGPMSEGRMSKKTHTGKHTKVC